MMRNWSINRANGDTPFRDDLEVTDEMWASAYHLLKVKANYKLGSSFLVCEEKALLKEFEMKVLRKSNI